MKGILLRVSVAAALSACAAGPGSEPGWPPERLGAEVSVPFISMNNLRDFRADGDQGVWLQDRSRRWFYARTLGPCMGLPFAVRIGVDTRFGGNQLDRTGTLLVDRQRCPLTSLTASNGPPPRQARRRRP